MSKKRFAYLVVIGTIVLVLSFMTMRLGQPTSQLLEAPTKVLPKPEPVQKVSGAAPAEKRASAQPEIKPAPIASPQAIADKLQRAFNEHPEYRQAYYANLRRLRLRAFGDLAGSLGLDAQVANRVSDLLFERVLSQLDITQLVESGGTTLSPADVAKVRMNNAKGIDDEIRQLLGDEKYALLQIIPGINRYETELRSDYAVDFRAANDSLTADQAHELAVIMAKNMNWNNRPMADGPSDDNPFLMKSESMVLKRAQAILSEKQIDALKKRFEDKNIERIYAAQYFPKADSR